MTSAALKRSTMVWVALAHLLLFLLFFFLTSQSWFRPAPTPYLEMVDLSQLPTLSPESAQTKSVEPNNPEPVQPPEPVVTREPEPIPEPTPVPLKTLVPEPTPAPTPETKVEPKPVPKKNVVEVDLTQQVTKSTATATVSNSPSTSSIRKSLSENLASTQSNSPTADEIAAYRAMIKRVLYSAWVRPGLQNDQLEASVMVRVLPNGALRFLSLKSSSGNAIFDQSVTEAVHSVRKLPQPLPKGMGNPDYQVPIIFVSRD
ncbi:MAG: TonB family protein [Verrucomicrobiota bacterium]